jgi:hypothetical protein
MTRRPRGPLVDTQKRACAHCASPFQPKVSWQRFCHRFCREAYRREHAHPCPRCGKKCRPRKPSKGRSECDKARHGKMNFRAWLRDHQQRCQECAS